LLDTVDLELWHSKSWLPLEDRAYLQLSSAGKEDRVVITGLPDAGMDGENVLLLG